MGLKFVGKPVPKDQTAANVPFLSRWSPVAINRFRIYRDNLDDYADVRMRVLITGLNRVELNAGDIDEMLTVPGRIMARDVMTRRFDRGDFCLGYRKDGRLVGFIWIVFNWLNFGAYNLPLQSEEAYLIDAYVAPEFRGKGLGAYLYVKVIEALKSQGFKTIYSVTIIDNSLAIGLRGRLRSHLVDEGVSVTFFNRWRFGTKARPERLRAPEK